MTAFAGTYKLQHSAVACRDDRTSRRFSIRGTIFVARYLDGFIDELQAAVCRDISTSGISFFVRREPDTRQLIVDLSRRSFLLVILCNVVRKELTLESAEPAYLVGCEFIEVWRQFGIECA